MSHPRPAYPILANEDYELLQRAVFNYLDRSEIADGPERQKYSNLGQRLGSMAMQNRRNAMVWE